MILGNRTTFTALLLACSALALTSNGRAESYHFVNGFVITMAEQGLRASELLVSDGTITSIGRGLSAPGSATVIDLEGGYLMPGLAEMHAHVPSPQQEQQYRDDVLFLYVANGITTMRGMLGSPAHLELREALKIHAILGPRLITSGPSFNGRSVSSPDQARKMVEAQHAAGYDFLKIHPGLELDEYDAVASTANRLGIPFAGHVPAAVGLEHALRSGQATVDHLDGYVQALVPDLTADDDAGLFALSLLPRVDVSLIPEIASVTKQSGTWVVPTDTLLENFAGGVNLSEITTRPQNAYLPEQVFANYKRALSGLSSNVDAGAASAYLDLRRQILAALHQAGVGILLGSDAPQIFNVPGFSAHRELAATVSAGISPFDALQTGTVNPARFFNRTTEFGSLASGMAADLIWLEDNPLTDIQATRSIRGVMVRGRWLDRAFLDDGLERIRKRHVR